MIDSRSSFGDPRRRRRQLLYWRLLRVLLAIVGIVTVGGYAYQVGVSADQVRTGKLEADLARLQQSDLELRDQLALTTERSGQADQALEDLRRRYALDVPRGEVAALLARVATQLEAGVEPARLAFLIEAAAAPESCDGQPVTKRFMPRTPIATGLVSYVRFDDRITVTATGQPARNAEGLVEAWYDPTYPIRLEFRALDGAIVTVEGVPPLSHCMVVDRREYRFGVVPGERWFVEVTAQACAFPAKDAAPQDAGPDGASLG